MIQMLLVGAACALYILCFAATVFYEPNGSRGLSKIWNAISRERDDAVTLHALILLSAVILVIVFNNFDPHLDLHLMGMAIFVIHVFMFHIPTRRSHVFHYIFYLLDASVILMGFYASLAAH